MSKNHARKNRAKKIAAATGSGHASAVSGTAHRHQGPKIPPYDGTPFGEPRTVDMSVASALIGACADACAACEQSGINAMVGGDRLAVLGLAGPPFAVLGSLGPANSSALAPIVQEFASVAGGPEAWSLVQRLEPLELAALIDQALNVWTAVGNPNPDAAGDADEPDDDGDEELSPFAVLSCAYVACVGVTNLVADDQLEQLAVFAESRAAEQDPIECFVCSKTIDVYAEQEVHIGLLLGPEGGIGYLPVWTHAKCASSRVWSEAELEAERRLHRADPADAAADKAREPSAGSAEADWTFFSIVQLDDGIYPLLVVQPGTPHQHGLNGHMTEMLSHGLLPVDLSGAQRPTTASSLAVHTERGRLTSISRNGVPWYTQRGGHATPGQWRRAALAKKQVLLMVLPHGTITETETDFREPLRAAAKQGRLLGGLVTRYGTL